MLGLTTHVRGGIITLEVLNNFLLHLFGNQLDKKKKKIDVENMKQICNIDIKKKLTTNNLTRKLYKVSMYQQKKIFLPNYIKS